MNGDATIEVLKQIRDGISSMDERLSRRLDQTNQRLEQLTHRMGRVEQGLLDLGKFMKGIALELTKYDVGTRSTCG